MQGVPFTPWLVACPPSMVDKTPWNKWHFVRFKSVPSSEPYQKAPLYLSNWILHPLPYPTNNVEDQETFCSSCNQLGYWVGGRG